MSEARFLKLSEGIPEYTGSDLEQIRSTLLEVREAVESGARLVPEGELDVEIRKLQLAS